MGDRLRSQFPEGLFLGIIPDTHVLSVGVHQPGHEDTWGGGSQFTNSSQLIVLFFISHPFEHHFELCPLVSFSLELAVQYLISVLQHRNLVKTSKRMSLIQPTPHRESNFLLAGIEGCYCF